MARYRIVIRAFTCRRDVAPAALLSRYLEQHGCEVRITGTSNYVNTIKHWKPHGVIINVPGMALRTRQYAPDCKIIFLDGEGFQMHPRSGWWMDHPEEFAELDLILVWGSFHKEDVRNNCSLPGIERVHIVGNPKLDLVRYLPDSIRNADYPKSIGAVCRFNSINNHQGIMTIDKLSSELNLKKVINQCYSFRGLVKSIKAILENTDYSVSIRPHPLEQLDSYHKYYRKWFGKEFSHRVEIDDSLVFPEWAVKQKAIISPTSTSFLEAYLLDTPVINLDRVCDTEKFNNTYAAENAEWQQAGYMPANTDELCEMIESDLGTQCNDLIENQLEKYCDWHRGYSTVKRTTGLILDLLQQSVPVADLRWPKFALDAYDYLLFKKLMKDNPLHHNFNFYQGYHDVPDYFSEMVQLIDSDTP